MAKEYYLKTRDIVYPTQKLFKERLKRIRDEQEYGGYISDPEYISDLQDFLEDYHPSKEFFLENYDVRNCKFFVAKSENYNTKSLYIQDESEAKKHSFSVEKFSLASPLANFSQACSYILQDKKLLKKLELINEENRTGSPSDYELVHLSPKFIEIIKQFIQEQNLNEKLSDVVSENGLGNNAPFFTEEYKLLENEFLKFYDSLNLRYELRD